MPRYNNPRQLRSNGSKISENNGKEGVATCGSGMNHITNACSRTKCPLRAHFAADAKR